MHFKSKEPYERCAELRKALDIATKEHHRQVIGRKSVGQVQNGSSHTCLDKNDENFQNVIVDSLSSLSKIDWNQRFVVPIFFVTRRVATPTSVIRIVNEHHISCFAILGDFPESFHNVLLGWTVMTTIVHQDKHFGFLESLLFDQDFLMLPTSEGLSQLQYNRKRDVHEKRLLRTIMATRKLSLLSNKVDANQQGPLAPLPLLEILEEEEV